jgi:hypothetical protein
VAGVISFLWVVPFYASGIVALAATSTKTAAANLFLKEMGSSAQ